MADPKIVQPGDVISAKMWNDLVGLVKQHSTDIEVHGGRITALESKPPNGGEPVESTTGLFVVLDPTSPALEAPEVHGGNELEFRFKIHTETTFDASYTLTPKITNMRHGWTASLETESTIEMSAGARTEEAVVMVGVPNLGGGSNADLTLSVASTHPGIQRSTASSPYTIKIGEAPPAAESLGFNIDQVLPNTVKFGTHVGTDMDWVELPSSDLHSLTHITIYLSSFVIAGTGGADGNYTVADVTFQPDDLGWKVVAAPARFESGGTYYLGLEVGAGPATMLLKAVMDGDETKFATTAVELRFG